MEYRDVIAAYREYNDEERLALEYAKNHENAPYMNDLAQVMDGRSLIRDGIIMIRKHPRFCFVSKHSHNYLEINYVLSGEVTQILDGNKLTLKQGEMVFLSRNAKHEFLPANEGDILLNFIILPEFFTFIFPFIDSQGNMKKFLLNLLSNKDENNSIIFRLGNCEPVQNLIQNILMTYEEKDERMNELLRSYFLVLIYELLKHAEEAEQTETANYDSVLLFKTYNYIENNYVGGSLKELSEILKEDYNYLSKKLKKLTGFSFQQLLEKERLKVSKNLLETTDISINDIAYHVGYNNLTFFYSLFKKRVGMTPLQYRKQSLASK